MTLENPPCKWKHVRSKLNRWLIHWHGGLLRGYQCDIWWLASLAAFMCVSPSSLTSTASLERSWVRWFICVCESVLCASRVGPWTHNCACGGDNVRVHWSVSKLEVSRISLARYLAHTYSPLTCQPSWRTECQTSGQFIRTSSQRQVHADSSNQLFFLYYINTEEKHVQPYV